MVKKGGGGLSFLTKSKKNSFFYPSPKNVSRYINSQGGRTGYWLSLLSLAAAGAILNLIPSPHQVGNVNVRMIIGGEDMR